MCATPVAHVVELFTSENGAICGPHPTERILRQFGVRPVGYGWLRAVTSSPSTPTSALEGSSHCNASAWSVVLGMSCSGGAIVANRSSHPGPAPTIRLRPLVVVVLGQQVGYESA
jgi:hypothetical protein